MCSACPQSLPPTPGSRWPSLLSERTCTPAAVTSHGQRSKPALPPSALPWRWHLYPPPPPPRPGRPSWDSTPGLAPPPPSLVPRASGSALQPQLPAWVQQSPAYKIGVTVANLQDGPRNPTSLLRVCFPFNPLCNSAQPATRDWKSNPVCLTLSPGTAGPRLCGEAEWEQ